MKKVAIYIVIGIIIISGCIYLSGNTMVRLNKQWDLDLPYFANVEHKHNGIGWFGEGYYYYVVEFDENDIDESAIFSNTKEPNINSQVTYEDLIKSHHIVEEFEIDWESNVLWAMHENNNRTLYVIVTSDKLHAIFIEIVN